MHQAQPEEEKEDERRKMMLRYYHYRRLSPSSKNAYKAIVAAARKFSSCAVIDCVENVKAVIDAVKNDNPQLFYINWYTIFYKIEFRGYKTIIYFDYIMGRREALAYWKKSVEFAPTFCGRTDYETIKNVHDYIASCTRYDQEIVDNNGFRINDHNMIGPIYEGLAVCEGISRAAQFLLKELNVECTYQNGYVNDGYTSGYHAWNLVRVDGKIKKMDITWDLADDSGRISYRYFCVAA